MRLKNNKKGDLLGDVFIVIITLIVFFALWPAAKVLIDLAISVNAGNDPTTDFLLGTIGFVIIFGLIKWIFNTTGTGGGAAQ